MLYANLLVYSATIALLIGFHREVSWAAKTLDAYVRSGRFQPTVDRLLVSEALRYRKRHRDDLEGVAALLQRAVEVDPYSSTRIHLADVHRAQGDDDDALALYEQYRAIDPLELHVYLAMVEILEQRREVEAAERLLAEGIEHFRIQLERCEPRLDPSVGTAFNAKARKIHQSLAQGLEVLDKTRERIRESM